MRGAPQYGLATAIRWINARSSELAGGRPALIRWETLAQLILNPFRCQPTTVSAFTRCKARRQGAQIRESTTQNSRSFLPSLGTLLLLFSTASCWRRARFSSAKSRRSRTAALIRIPSHRNVSIRARSLEGIGRIINDLQADGILANHTIPQGSSCLTRPTLVPPLRTGRAFREYQASSSGTAGSTGSIPSVW